MSLSNEALRKVSTIASLAILRILTSWQLLTEIESQAIATQQQIGLVKGQMASKQREMRLAQLTRSEISTLPSDTAVYEGVGKMYYLPYPRLVAIDIIHTQQN